MRKLWIFLVVAAIAIGGYVFYARTNGSGSPGTAGGQGGQPGGPGGRGGPGGGFGGFNAGPLTVELAAVTRASVTEQLTVVGNLIGAATVEVVPKVNGRLDSVNVRLGDRVGRDQLIAQIDDREIRQQVKQAEAAYAVGEATVRQREADLKFADSNLERSRSLFARQLLPRQDMDDADARQQAAAAQLDLARAQFSQAGARLEELRITLANTQVLSPVNGFVGKRYLDQGAYASTNTAVASVVDISSVRLVVNLVERDLKRVTPGVPGEVEVDAFPGEMFAGRVARMAPVLDAATRTAEMEIEIPNSSYRLKPGMYARVKLTVGERKAALVVPRNALISIEGRRGVFVFDSEGSVAHFQAVETGLEDQERTEILGGLTEGQQIVTTGAGALRDGDRVQLAGVDERPRGERPANAGPTRNGRPDGSQRQEPAGQDAPLRPRASTSNR